MKKLHLLGMAMIIAMAFASCGSNKQMVNNQPQQQQTVQQQPQQQQQQQQQSTATDNSTSQSKDKGLQPPQRVAVEIDCYKASRSDDKFFRELGVGKDPEEGEARINAIDNAYEMMERRLTRVVNGVQDKYRRTVKNQDATEVEKLIDAGFHNVIKGVLDAANNPCESKNWEEGGNYVWYYVIEISKEDFGTKLQKELSKDKKYGTLFDQTNFFNKYNEELGIDAKE